MSKERREIVAALGEAGRQGRETALATVVDVRGSAYRRPGARMLVVEGGPTAGNVSGGCLEADVRERAKKVMATGEPELVVYDTTSDADLVWGLGLGCNGVVRVFVERVTPEDARAIDEREGISATVVTGPHAGSRLTLSASGESSTDISDDAFAAAVLDAARAFSEQRRATTQPVGDAEVFFEATRPSLELTVLGAGYDAMPVVAFAKDLGWRVTVGDPRPAFATGERFPSADRVVVMRPEEAAAHVPDGSYVVIMTHNFAHDGAILASLAGSNPVYVGILGPAARTEKLLTGLKEEGVALGDLVTRIHAPIGLDIGAETPEQIALAIVAEIQAASAGHVGGRLKDRPGPIHY